MPETPFPLRTPNRSRRGVLNRIMVAPAGSYRDDRAAVAGDDEFGIASSSPPRRPTSWPPCFVSAPTWLEGESRSRNQSRGTRTESSAHQGTERVRRRSVGGLLSWLLGRLGQMSA